VQPWQRSEFVLHLSSGPAGFHQHYRISVRGKPALFANADTVFPAGTTDPSPGVLRALLILLDIYQRLCQ
jgi:hypothetical protein